jgi:L-fucose mutarotase
MLRGIPKCLSPELLKVMDEMGHGDTLILADAFYPAAFSARHSMLVRADGLRATEIMDAVLQFFPLDRSVEHPVLLMDKQECDKAIPTPIWDEYKDIVVRHDERGLDCVGMIGRFDFYKAAEHAYAVVATGETSLYGCVILQKGTI